MSRVDLALLRSLVLVVESGGFTSAEKRVHRTQSTISQQIRRLEKQVGAELLTRSREGISPTEAGERVLSYARRFLALESELKAAVAAPREATTVHLGITDDFAQLHLARLLDRARRVLPNVRLHVTCDLSVALRSALARGDLDLALYKRTRREGAGVRVLSEQIEWVAARGYELDRARPLPLVLFPAGCVYRQRALAMLDAANQPWTVVFESPSTVSVQAAVRAGLGLATLTASSTPDGCRALAGGLPRLGKAELVHEFGRDPPPEARQLLAEILGVAG